MAHDAPISFTYRVRLRVTNEGWEHRDWWVEPRDGDTHPLIVGRHIGTIRSGWPWARYDHDQWVAVAAARDMEDAAEVIRKDALKQAEKFANKSHGDRIRETFGGPRRLIVTVMSDGTVMGPT